MKKMMRGWGILLLAFSANSVPAELPLAAFARQEAIRSVSVSPDGHYLAYIASIQGKRAAMILDLTSGSGVPHQALGQDKDGKFDLRWCHWANDTRLLCGFIAPISDRGVTFRISRLVAVNADGGDIKVLMRDPQFAIAGEQDAVLDWLPHDPQHVLIQSVADDPTIGATGGVFRMSAPSSFPQVFALDIYTGRVTVNTPRHPPIRRFITDGEGNVRSGTGLEGLNQEYFARLAGEKEWHQLVKVEAFKATDTLRPIEVIAGTNKAYALGPSHGRQALWTIDLEDKSPPTLVFDHPQADIEGIYTNDTGHLLGVAYETSRPFVFYVDSHAAAVVDAVKAHVPDSTVTIVSASRDRSVLVIRSASDVDAGTFYLFNIKTGSLSNIGSAYPELDPQSLPKMRGIEYAAADGTKIPGYLTVPVGSNGKNLPLIVMPHGGPISRDSWRFDFLRHFLVSRGYGVLQMNFRGSSGYGAAWQLAAHQDWGGLTYSDIADGARWAVAQGIADPHRMCIVGWSFGGYSALVGATRNADLFRCSVSIAGLSDLSAIEKLYRAYYLDWQVVREQIGTDATKLERDSPLRHAAEVSMPVLMIHGDLDAQAPFEQSENMAKALKLAGKDYKFVPIAEGDHSLWRESERETLLSEVDAFLKANLSP